ncbi:MAG TPA: 2OG-Fe(II) oxygenase [Methylotenera sp.]|nr:2OG-Fe(II) oxygenase [Methylotenera sp.]
MFHQATLPITLEDGVYLNAKEAKQFGENLSGDYCFAEPFPHIVIDNFLPEALINKIIENFPTEKLEGDVVFNGGYAGLYKRQIMPADCNGFIREVFGFFNSHAIVEFLQSLTTIPSLIPDPYFVGGGFHETSTGGKLGIHADFRINDTLHLNRRLNVIIYLNRDWKDEYGGHLELWDKKMQGKVHTIAPIFNRCVIFNTDADSFHGHPDPLTCPETVKRRSLALYYYTASKRIYEDTVAHSTMYKARPDDDAATKKEVRELVFDNYLRDLTPPVFYRIFRKVKDKLKREKGKLGY